MRVVQYQVVLSATNSSAPNARALIYYRLFVTPNEMRDSKVTSLHLSL